MTVRILTLAIFLAATKSSASTLDQVYERAAKDIKAGKPLVIHVIVPLCDNNSVQCGNNKLGNGDNADTNLYWATSGGFRGWFAKKKYWKQVKRVVSRTDIVEQIVWTKQQRPTKTWRKYGVTRPFRVYLIAEAWRGSKIENAMKRFAENISASTNREILVGKVAVAIGGDSHLLAYVGHNGWMDFPKFKWPKQQSTAKTKAVIAIACLTKSWLKDHIIRYKKAAPVLLTTSLLFAGAHSLEGAATTFARGGNQRAILKKSISNYAIEQKRPVKRIRKAFTNPSAKNWK